MGFKAEKEKRILVYYFGNVVGDYNADLIVEAGCCSRIKSY